MSSTPVSAITSASPSFWQVMPFAPASICIFASIGDLCVLICGRLSTSAASQAAWMRAMLRSTRSMSMTAAGVPYSRAILAASGVVMNSGLLNFLAQNFKFQPFVLGGGELILGDRDRSGRRVECLAILPVEIGIVKQALLLGDLRLQLGDRRRQLFQCVFLVEGQPALRRGSGGGRLRLALVLDFGGGLDHLALKIDAALGQHVGIAAGIFDPAA